MAEIYSSSQASALSSLSPEAADHINQILADLGLPATPATEVPASDAVSTTSVSGGESILVGDAAAHASASPFEPGATQATASGGDAALPNLAGDAVATGTGDGTTMGGAGDDVLSGGTQGGRHAIYSGGGHDTLYGGNGMDTLWGGDAPSLLVGGVNGRTEMHAGTGGDAMRSEGGFDTLYGGGATITESGGHSLMFVNADTVATHGSFDTVDGSASHAGSQIDVYGAHSTILGGAGNDTVALHDLSGAPAFVEGGAGNDTIAASIGGHATLSGGAGNDHLSSYGVTDSIGGGDGSDVFTIAHHGIGFDTIDGGTGDDNLVFQDRSFADAHFATQGHTTLVTFNDGYSAAITGVEHIRFNDTVYNI